MKLFTDAATPATTAAAMATAAQAEELLVSV
jgi:hypothetical protein